MSCRIVTGKTASIRRLTLPGAVSDAMLDTAGPSLELPETSDDVAQLHSRIVELERALQRDVRQAREAGFREGEKAGRQQAATEVEPVLERLSKAIADLSGVRSSIRRETEADLVTLAIAIARRILRREVSIDPDALQGLVKTAFERMQARDVCRIRVHAEHAPAIRKHLSDFGIASGAEIVADPALQRGDLIIETNRGDLDASVETQLREIERGFADRFKEEG